MLLKLNSKRLMQCKWLKKLQNNEIHTLSLCILYFQENWCRIKTQNMCVKQNQPIARQMHRSKRIRNKQLSKVWGYIRVFIAWISLYLYFIKKSVVQAAQLHDSKVVRRLEMPCSARCTAPILGLVHWILTMFKITIHSLKNPNHINEISHLLPEIWHSN